MRRLLNPALYRNNGIGRRLIVALILFSSILTALITAIELYFDYRNDINAIENRFNFIKHSYLPTLRESVWVSDELQITTQLTGLSRLQDIESLSIIVDGKTRWKSGAVSSTRTIEHDIPILREYRGRTINIGTLHIVASVDNVISRLLDKLITILISNGIKTILVSVFMLLLFQIMVGRHLEHISYYLRNLGKQPVENDHLKLERKDSGRWRPDALDHVVYSINEMRKDIVESQRKVLELNANLERRVDERTAELEALNHQLSDALEEIKEVSQAKSLFLSRMSHELRTPLNAICGFSQLLKLEKLSDDQQESVDWIVKAGNHLLHLINDLLDLSRIDVGKLQIVLEPVALSNVVNDALNMTQVERDYRGIVLENQCPEDLVVEADATRLTQILVNLLSNASKYNRPGGEVQISCEPLAGRKQVRIKVSDSGYGIAEEKQAKLFQPFERLGKEFSEIEGTGTGLALSKSLAELMSANMGFSSTPGRGSSFWLDLPLSEAQAAPLQDVSAKQLDRQEGYRVLYVEDNLANLKLVKNIFKHHPEFILFTAIDGGHGLEVARRELPDVILLDIHLPVKDGYQVQAELKAEASTRDIPVIALTADAMPNDIQQGMEAGFRHYLTKPIDHERLLETIRSVL